MGCCCNDNNSEYDPEMPEGTEPCCAVRGKHCMCLPYDDGFLITAQVLTILSLMISWIWWPAWLLNLIGVVLFQLLWCLRQNQRGIQVSVLVEFLCAMANLGVGSFVLLNWRNRRECLFFVFSTWGILYTEHDKDDCAQNIWGSMAMVCGALWLVAASCLFYFGVSGRHAQWEQLHANRTSGAGNNTSNNNNNSNNTTTSNAAAAVVVELANPPESDDDKQDDIES